jgi:AraC-like DNA-binding protein
MGADEFVSRRPAPAHRPLIGSSIGYRSAGRPGLHRGPPTRHLTLIVSIGEPNERATTLLRSPGRPALADVAAACGYYDQPPLNRDFVELAGCPPGEWLAAEFPSVQDPGPLEPARSSA